MQPHLSIYRNSLALLTDLYQLTMAYAYWKEGIAEKQAVFHLYFRKKPFQGNFAIAAGLETAIEFIKNFHFDKSDLEYLASLKSANGKAVFEKAFLKYLEKLSFQCDIKAVAEGTVIFPNEPILQVKGPILQAQLLESPLLNIINFQTLIATKAARICLAAKGDRVVEFGMRRAHGIDGALSASRAAFIGGCESTSHVLAGKMFGIPVRGTQAHSWVMAFDEEKKAFESFCNTMPDLCFVLIDTYDSLEGVKKAIAVAKAGAKKGIKLQGVRLDSGDLTQLSIEIRKMLDKAGLKNVEIMASNELDEYFIQDLKRQGAKINVWGVGTNLVTAKGQSALDGIYKLSAIKNNQGKWQNKIKLSEQSSKTTTPGILQVRRFLNKGKYLADMIFDERTSAQKEYVVVDILDPAIRRIYKNKQYRDLLVPIFKKGKLCYTSLSLSEIRKEVQKELSCMSSALKRFLNPEFYLAGLEQSLYEEKIALINKLKSEK